jgi:hypothetical protein
MPTASYEFVGEAITQLFVGIGLALLNLLVVYFAPRLPRIISILRWNNTRRAILVAYLIALAIQLVTSPFFASAFHPVSIELAWSPYQALFNVLGVLLIDVIVMVWEGARRGAEVGRERLDQARSAAAERLDDVGARLALTPEGREEAAARAAERQEEETEASSERKQRIDDRLKDY